jgi:hypothetical protein
MGDGSARRDVLLLVLTHSLAFVVPVLPLIPSIRNIVHGASFLNEWTTNAFSQAVAGFQVRVGDDVAAVAGLKRHLDRLMVLRNELAAGGAGPADLNVLDGDMCFALAEIAFLSTAEERAPFVADAAACQQKVCPKCRNLNAQHVLDLGARRVGSERGSE